MSFSDFVQKQTQDVFLEHVFLERKVRLTVEHKKQQQPNMIFSKIQTNTFSKHIDN